MNNEERIAEQKALGPCVLGHSWRFRDPINRRCLECERLNDERGHARKLKRGAINNRPKPKAKSEMTPYFQTARDGSVDAEDFAKFLVELSDNPVRAAAIAADSRRPKGVTRVRHGIALRKAVREPMLNASPGIIRKALKDFKNDGQRLAVDSIYKSFVVKPTSTVSGAKGWHERLWKAYTLRYARGMVIVTDTGEQSKPFNSWGEARKAVIGSGWEIMR